jgi:type I restriction enzyme M protein
MLPSWPNSSFLTTPTQELVDAIWRAGEAQEELPSVVLTKEYLLTVLFVKYLSDWWDERQQDYQVRYAADPEWERRVQRAMSRERFQVPERGHFAFLYTSRDRNDIGEVLNQALEALEEANPVKLAGAFPSLDFASKRWGASTGAINSRLRILLQSLFAINLAPGYLGGQQVAGDLYEGLLARFATEAGRLPEEFYTPPVLTALLTQLVAPQPGDRICDPACGSASLLLRAGRQVPGGGSFALYGQEVNPTVYALARQNCVLHEQEDAVLALGDTLTAPQLIEDKQLLRFDVVVTSPPSSLGSWGRERVEHDPYQRFRRGLPPSGNGDFAFISHLVATLADPDGRGSILVLPGVLFRGGAEGRIRQQLLEDGLIEAVIGLPANVLYTSSLAPVVLLLRRRRPTTDVLFVDASHLAADARGRATLQPAHLDRLQRLVRAFQQAGATGPAGVVEPGLAYRATLAQIAMNEFNLSLPRYVLKPARTSPKALSELQAEADALEAQLAGVRDRRQRYLEEWKWYQ